MDDLTMLSLNLMEEKIVANIELEKLLRDGHIELAKARYIQGKETVGMLQVPVDEEQLSSLFNLETSLLKSEKKDVEVPHFDISMKLKTSEGDLQDPIKWFGVLVPQSLKNAQKRFQEALYLVVKLANIQAKLLAIPTELNALKDFKRSNSLVSVEQ